MKERYTLAEWQEELTRRAGGVLDQESSRKITFTCPACKETHSVGEFADYLEARGELSGWDPTDAATQCYHRFTEDGRCDWCSYGLFCGPVTLDLPDGHKGHVFQFGEEAMTPEM